MRFIRYSSVILAATLLAACAGGGSSQAVKNAPKIAGTWKPLGNINNMVVSYDAGSMRRSGDLAWLRDRKIVINPEQERYAGTPRYKVAVGDWEFNCRNRSFRVTAVQFLDERGRIVSQERYTAHPIPPMPIQRGTIADKQFGVACNK